MKKPLALIILLITNFAFCQLKAVVINSETKQGIPYVNIWVDNENCGATATKNGEFELKTEGSKTVILSAIGYETKKIISTSVNNTIELKPLVTKPDKASKAKKGAQKFIIDRFKNTKVSYYFGSGTKPWIYAKYFKYNKRYKKTPFLNKIKLLTNSSVDDSKFIVRLYNLGPNREPGSYINAKNIIGIAKKGKRITEIDVSNLNIKFPKKGFFIAVEWLIIDNNKFDYSYPVKGVKNETKVISYEPAIGTMPTETNENNWIFTQGVWSKVKRNSRKEIKKYKGKYSLLAVELTVTD